MKKNANFSTYDNHDTNEILLDKVASWIFSDELNEVIRLFDGNPPSDADTKEYIHWLSDFSTIWDYRGSNNDNTPSSKRLKERWQIEGDSYNTNVSEAVVNAAINLGLKKHRSPSRRKYDVCLILGGARYSCLYRSRYADELKKNGYIIDKIAGLTCMRKVADIERTATNTYAVGAKTEYDLMQSALMNVFNVNTFIIEDSHKSLGIDCNGDMQYEDDALNEAWCVSRAVNNKSIMLFSAPSSDPEKRRANSADTFNYWAGYEKINSGINILLITSQIYVPYQQIEAVRLLGIPYNVSIETVGYPDEYVCEDTQNKGTAYYLQEIRSTILSMEKLIEYIKKTM